MDHYYEGKSGVVCDFDLEGPTHSLTEYAAYSTQQLMIAAIRGCEPWDIDWTTGG